MESNFVEDISSADDITLAGMAKGGNSAALTALLERYSDTVRKQAASFKQLIGLESDDLYQEGMLGLLSAVYSYDEGRGASFSTYSSLLINRKMLSAIRAANSKKNIPMREYVPIEETDLLSAVPTPEELLLHTEELVAINEFIENNLSKTEKKVLKLNLLGLSYSEIAEILDCSEKSVDNALFRIRRKFREYKR